MSRVAAVTESGLKSDLKSKSFKTVYYFYGKDTAAVESYTNNFISRLVDKENADYNFHSFDGKNFDMDAFTDACEALPFFGEHVCCTVCDLNAETLSAEFLKRLTEFIGDLPESTTVIFYYTSVDVTDGRKYPTAKNKKLMDAVGKAGNVCNFALKTPAALSKEIMARVSAANCGISKEAATFLAEQCLCNSMIIFNEVDKLTAYASGNEITFDMIRELSPRQIDTTAFDLVKAIVRMDVKTAMRLFDDLTAENTEPIPILYAISGSMLDLYRARTAMSARKYAADVKEDFGYSKALEFRVDNAFRDVQRISLSHLRMCMKVLADTDAAMKSSKTDPMILLEEAIVKMLSFRD